jgi:O-antigen ligase
MLFRIQVVLVCEILAAVGTLFWPDWGLILLVFFTFVRPQDDRPNVAPLHIQGAITWAVVAATAFRPAVIGRRLGFAVRELALFIALFVLMCMSAIVSGWTVYSADQLNDSVTILVVCMLILMWINDQKHLTVLVWSLIFAGLHYVQMVIQSPTYMREDQFDRISFRNATNFGNPNFLALLMVIVTFLALGMIGAVRKIWLKVGLLAAICGFFFCFLKCQSRGGTLALGGSLLVFWLLQRRKLLVLFCLATGITLGLAFLAPATYLARLKTTANYQQDESAKTRLEMWSHSIAMIKSNPLLGIGPGNFGPRFPHGMTEHEAYLQTASEVGLPALLLYIALLCGGCRSAWIARRSASPSRKDIPLLLGVAEALICGIVAIAVAGFFTGLAFREFVYVTLCLAYCVRELAEKAPATAVEIELESSDAIADEGESCAKPNLDQTETAFYIWEEQNGGLDLLGEGGPIGSIDT